MPINPLLTPHSLLLTPRSPPTADDYSEASLRAFQERLAARYGDYSEMPLDVKAAYFEWELWRYHLTPYHQFYNRAVLPNRPGVRPRSFPSRDSSTWNGALLAQLSIQYAATKDRRLLARAAELIRGLHLFFEVTGQPGLMARPSTRPDDVLVDGLPARPANSLCSFLWAGLVAERHVFETIVDRKPNTARGQIDQALMEGVEQLRRFKLDRWVRTGRVVDSGRAQWVDTHAADDFYWKCNPHLVFEPTGPATNVYYAALDYLYAYWVMRFYHLDNHPAIAKQNLGVLQPTPGAAAP
jgi:hypothetical protein